MTPETPLAMLTRSLLQSKLWYVKLLSLFVTQIVSKTYHISPGTSIEQVGAGEAVRRFVNIVCSGNKNISYNREWIIVLWMWTLANWISFLEVVFQQETLYSATWLTSTHTSKSSEPQEPRSAVTLQTEDLRGPGIQARVGKVSARPLAKVCCFSRWVSYWLCSVAFGLAQPWQRRARPFVTYLAPGKSPGDLHMKGLKTLNATFHWEEGFKGNAMTSTTKKIYLSSAIHPDDATHFQ